MDTLHLLAKVLKIAFADRAQASGDPASVDVPVERITSRVYADQRRGVRFVLPSYAKAPAADP